MIGVYDVEEETEKKVERLRGVVRNEEKGRSCDYKTGSLRDCA